MKNDMYAIMKNGFLDITIGSWLHRVSEFYPDQDALVNVCAQIDQQIPAGTEIDNITTFLRESKLGVIAKMQGAE